MSFALAAASFITPPTAHHPKARSAPAAAPPDRKSTRLNSSHLVISYAVLCFRKKTRLNSSHLVISYAVFCLKKKTSFLFFVSVYHFLLRFRCVVPDTYRCLSPLITLQLVLTH